MGMPYKVEEALENCLQEDQAYSHVRQNPRVAIFPLTMVETFLSDRAVQKGNGLPQEGLWSLLLEDVNHALGARLRKKLGRDFESPPVAQKTHWAGKISFFLKNLRKHKLKESNSMSERKKA